MIVVDILIADENLENLHIIEQFFHNHWDNINVIKAHEQNKIIDQLETTDPTLVVISLSLAQLDKWKIIERLRVDKLMPIIGLVDQESSKLIDAGREKGIDAFLVKPLDSIHLNVYFPPLLSQVCILRQTQKNPNEKRKGIERRLSRNGRRWNDHVKKKRRNAM